MMEASDLWGAIIDAAVDAGTIKEADPAALAIIEQAMAHWINEGMERAAVIVKKYARLYAAMSAQEPKLKSAAYLITETAEHMTDAIRAAKGTGHD